MQIEAIANSEASTRELIRELRFQSSRSAEPAVNLPESNLWQIYCVVRERGDSRADTVFLGALKSLHRRRSHQSCSLSVEDRAPQEHKLVDDPMLAELWRAYKRCICAKRIQPAARLLADIEEQILHS